MVCGLKNYMCWYQLGMNLKVERHDGVKRVSGNPTNQEDWKAYYWSTADATMWPTWPSQVERVEVQIDQLHNIIYMWGIPKNGVQQIEGHSKEEGESSDTKTST